MNFSNLPYEIQFNYLVNLPYKDIISYCQTSIIAYNICQTESFWKYKARKLLRVSLDVISYGLNTPSKKYQKLEELYYNEPNLLIIYLIEYEELSQLLVLYNQVIDKTGLMSEILDTLVTKNNIKLMEDVTIMFREVLVNFILNNEINEIVRYSYFTAVLDNKIDLVNILNIYYNPNVDYSEDVDSWLLQWYHEQDPQKIASLTAAGILFDRLF